MYESGAQKSCIQKTNAIFSIYKMSEQQSLTPVGTFCDLKHNDFLFIIITSTNDGLQPFLKQVGPLTSCVRLKISQKSFKVALYHYVLSHKMFQQVSVTDITL
jgi:hypothetical protein